MGAAAVAVYLNALPNQFVSDAVPMIVQNRALAESREWAAWLGRDFYWGTSLEDTTLYRPVTVLSFLAHLRTSGTTPFPFLAGNALLHTLASLLVLRLGTRLVGRRPAVIGALLFAVHPLHTEAVAWVMGRSELLAAVFALAACLCALRSLARGAVSPHWWGSAAAVAYGAALGSKEHVALLPMWFGLAWAWDRPNRSGRAAAIVTLGAAAVFAVFLLMRAHALVRPPTGDLAMGLYNPAAVVSAPVRWLTAAAVVGRYAWLFVWPDRLSNDYSYAELTASTGLRGPEAGGLLASLALLGGIGLGARRAPGVALALALVPISFALVSNVPFAIGTIMAERLTYLPTAGLCLTAGWLITGLPRLRARLRPSKRPATPQTPLPILSTAFGLWRRPSACGRGEGGVEARRDFFTTCRLATAGAFTVTGVAALLTIVLGARTIVRNADWRDDATLATANGRTAPRSAKTLFSLSTVERLRGNTAQAQGLLRQALRIYPRNSLALMSLAETHLLQGEWPEAAEQYRKALELVPRNAEVRSNLGIALARARRPAEAEAEFREALRLDPRLLEPRLALAGLLLETHRPAAALQEFQEAVRLAPEDGLALYGVAQATLDLGDPRTAEVYARRAAAAGLRVPDAFWRQLNPPR